MATPRRTPHHALAARLLATGATSETRRPIVGRLPSNAEVASLADHLLTAFFPEWRHVEDLGVGDLGSHLARTLAELQTGLTQAIFRCVHRRCSASQNNDQCRARATSLGKRMMNALPGIRGVLLADVRAAFEADPAASGMDEIVACYPGVYAIAIYRAAHRLLREGAEILPRMLTEHAKSRTGIDIHPGANIGAPFFIDHGTGIVVGETTTIGDRVRIYQGVTLGALSVKRRAGTGPTAKAPSGKRHPTIEDDVVIYANATILGGTTIIGQGAVVGGNAFITYSVPPGTHVSVG